MYAARGVGLAAPQIGISLRIAVIDVTDGKNPEGKIVASNPEIIHAEASNAKRKGASRCRDFAVCRAAANTYQGGPWICAERNFTCAANNLLARASAPHEIDHLNGTPSSLTSEC